MNRFGSLSKPLMWFMTTLVLGAFVAGCGGGDEGQNSILAGSGATAASAPRVTAVAPLANASGVAISTKIITAAFSKAMNPATLTITSFTLACPAGTPVTGAVTYQAAGNVATLTLPAAPDLPPSTLCTATVTTGAKDTTGIPLAGNFVWTFTTGVTPDTTRPRVLSTFPADGATVATNTAITAVFTEDMAPATIDSLSPAIGSFTLACAPLCVSPAPAGNVSYAVGSRTATFALTPAGTVLEDGKTYTATINGTTLPVVTDLATNALAGNQAALPAASDFVWTFTTIAAIPPANVSVLSTNPAAGAGAVCANSSINATFDVPSGLRMDPATVTAATFTVTGPGVTSVPAASVALDPATGIIATFTPLASLTSGVNYTVTITGGATGVKDLAVPGNTMVSDFTWAFTAGPATVNCPAPIVLGAAAPFGGFGGAAGMTNEGLLTVINGDIGTTGASTLVTGFRDSVGDVYTITPLNDGMVNGRIYTAAPPPGGAGVGGNAATFLIASQALLDANTAFNDMSPASLPGGADPGAGQLGGLTLAPGVYQAAGGSFLITGSDLTLDAQGNANAVWVFQMASTLTVGAPGAPRSVILINGAQAKNVFWQVGSAATINEAGGGTMVGTIISSAATSFSTSGNVTIVTLEGRALALNASTTMVNTIINVPAP